MSSYLEHLFFETFPDDLKHIGGVKFTGRQIDILSCLASGKNNKAISKLLSISENTVAAHCNQMRQKAGCFSRQHLIEYLDRSGKKQLLTQYYLSLRQKLLFEKALKEVQQAASLQKYILIWCPCKPESRGDKVSKLLLDHLKLCGIKVKYRKTLTPALIKNSECVLGCFSKDYEKMQGHKKLEKVLNILVEKKSQLIPLLFDEAGITYYPEVFQEEDWIDFRSMRSYFESYFALLKRLFPTLNKLLEKIVGDFQEEVGNLKLEQSNKVYESNQTNQNSLSSAEEGNKETVNTFFKTSLWGGLSIAGFCFIVVLVFVKVFVPLSKEKAKSSLSSKQRVIRSDLHLPHESVLLNRRNILKTIDEKLKQQEGIQTVALVGVVGIGGAGKTTLARHYARMSKASIVWEINAETRESLINSFEDLAHALAKTQEEKQDLKYLREIKDQALREKKIFLIVKNKLEVTPSWLLIYDNVDNMNTIKKYFPSDPAAWGKGSVIITTRNENIKNHALIGKNSMINIQNLSPQEKYVLFANILYGQTSETSEKEKTQLIKFLRVLPPFPLDVSTAAYYIKDTKITFAEYLQRSQTLSKDFEKAKVSLIKEMTVYTKTRYGIITLTLEKMTQVNRDFRDLFLFISLIDSQNIPLDLLKKFKSEPIVEEFINKLRKNSFIVKENSKYKILNFSIHRSVQCIIYAYLNKILSPYDRKKLINIFSKILEKYTSNMIEKEEVIKLKNFANHLEIFLVKSQKDLHKNLEGTFRCNLGNIYRRLGLFKKAKKYCESCYVIFKDEYGKGNIKMAQIYAFLGNLYKDIGDYEEAETFFKKSLYLYKKSENHFHIGEVSTYLGSLYTYIGQNEKAISLLENALRIYKKNKFKGEVSIAWIIATLGTAYLFNGSYNQAKNLFMNHHGLTPVVSCRPKGRVQAALAPNLLSLDSQCTS